MQGYLNHWAVIILICTVRQKRVSARARTLMANFNGESLILICISRQHYLLDAYEFSPLQTQWQLWMLHIYGTLGTKLTCTVGGRQACTQRILAASLGIPISHGALARCLTNGTSTMLALWYNCVLPPRPLKRVLMAASELTIPWNHGRLCANGLVSLHCCKIMLRTAAGKSHSIFLQFSH